jgi:CubicO group peptidase (beta-lactamase class C family)
MRYARAAATLIAVMALAHLCLNPLAARGQGAGQAMARFANPSRATLLATAFPAVDEAFRVFARESNVPGIAWGILIDGELVHTGTAGYRELETRTPIDVDTVFRIASMTKSFTAIAILQLRDAGKLSLDDPADRYIPELAALKYPSADSPRITIRHLLSHAGGFPEDNPWGDRQLADTDEDLGRMMREGIPFSTAPATAYEYSNYGFAILGRIVRQVSGEPYPQYVAAHILKPLGMTATTLDPGAVPPGRLAHGYRWEDGMWKLEPPLPDGAFGCMGGMLTSTRDLARYVGFLMSAWPPRDDPESGPIKRSSAREMQQVWRPAPATVTGHDGAGVRLNAGGYGFGLRVWQTCSVPHVVAHSGGLPGFGSHMRWLPEHGVAIIALGNRTYTGWTRVADDAMALLERTGGLEPRVPLPSPGLLAARDDVSRLIGAWDDGLAARMAAGNLYLDESVARRRASLDAVRTKQGVCRPDGSSLETENALRGSWRMTCDRGWIRVAVTLAPTMPPRVQSWTVTPVLPPGVRTMAAAEAVATMIGNKEMLPGRPDILAPSADARAVRGAIEAVAWMGSCRVDDVLSGDGEGSAAFRLACTRGRLNLSLGINQESGKVETFALQRVGTYCN